MRAKIKRVARSGLVVKDAFSEFVGYQTARGMADSTIKTYHNHFRVIAKYFDVEKPFSELVQSDVENMIISTLELKNQSV